MHGQLVVVLGLVAWLGCAAAQTTVAQTYKSEVQPGKYSFLVNLTAPAESEGLNITLTAEGGALELFCVFGNETSPPVSSRAQFSAWTEPGAVNQTAVIFVSLLDHPEEHAVSCAARYPVPEGSLAPPLHFTLSAQPVTNVSLDEGEVAAAEQLFNECCSGAESCKAWQRKDDGKPELDLCHFKGSYCNPQGRLLQLDMTGYGLECTFPEEALLGFTELRTLRLGSNNLKGAFDQIGSNLAKLKELRHLDVSGSTSITGSLGSIKDKTGACALALYSLDVSSTGVEGGLPGCLFGSESLLHKLRATENKLSGLPAFNATAPLQYLDLSRNDIQGTVPEDLPTLASLQELNLAQNSLTGTLPTGWEAAKVLHTVDLSGNQIEGSLPPALAGHPSLLHLDMSNNKLHMWGPVDTRNSPLVLLDMSFNELSECGFLAGIELYPNLTYLYVHDAEMQGEMPDDEGMFKSARFIDLSNNNLTGSIPDAWSTVGVFTLPIQEVPEVGRPTFNTLNLAYNNLSGDLPDWLSATGLAAPVDVTLTGNNFTNGCTPDFVELKGACNPAASPATPDSEPSSDDSSSGGDSGLSSGAIAGIVISILVCVGIAAGFIVYARRKQHMQAGGSLWGGQERFEKFEEHDNFTRPPHDDFTRPPQDLEMPPARAESPPALRLSGDGGASSLSHRAHSPAP